MIDKLIYPTQLGDWRFPAGKVIAYSRGMSGSTTVHLKRFPASRFTREYEKQLRLFRASGYVHENLIRFLTSETVTIENLRFTIIATEICLCSVGDLWDANNSISQRTRMAVLTSVGTSAILRQSAEAVAFLHRLNIIHRNLKPTNFLIAQVAQYPRAIYVVKLDDIGQNLRVDDFNSRIFDPDWTAPEILNEKTVNLKMDTFVLGCYFYFVLTRGKHPFDSSRNRLSNIMDVQFPVYQGNWNPGLTNPLANQLVRKMIQWQLKLRPSMEEVLTDEFFESADFKCYDLYSGHEKPGLCVIFSQTTNQGQLTIELSNDRNRLARTFTSLGCDAELHGYCTKQDLLNSIRHLCENWVPKYASVIICILARNENGLVAGVYADQLRYALCSENCPELHGKPKILLIRPIPAQRPKFPPLFHSRCAHTSNPPPVVDNSLTEATTVVRETTKSLTLKLMSTIPGFVGHQNQTVDSDFVKILCDQLDALQPGEARNLNECLSGRNACGDHAPLWAHSLDDRRRMICRLCLAKNMCEMRSSLQKQIHFRKVRPEHRGQVVAVENGRRTPFLVAN